MWFFDFCAGIGAGRLGLEQAGMTCVGYSEINRTAIKTYNLLHDTSQEKKFGNLTKLDPITLPEFDVLIAGFPCQTFSVIGRGEGFNDERGQIIFHLRDILKTKKTPYFVLENVKGLTTHDGGKSLQKIVTSLEEAGYWVKYSVLSSMSYGVPQMRQRVYFIGIRNDLLISDREFKWQQPEKENNIKDFLCDINNEISKTNLDYFIEYLKNKTNLGKYKLEDLLNQEYLVIDTRQSDLRLYYNRVPTLRSSRDGLYYIREGKLRELTGNEAMLLQGFPKSYADKVKNSVEDRILLRQAGNAMTVGVIKSIGQSLLDYNKGAEEEPKKIVINTIVGIVKSRLQYDFCVGGNVYYTYKNNISSDISLLKYVALYQPKSAFGAQNAGIFIGGEISKIEEVNRFEIPFAFTKKSDTKCYLIKVKEWKKMKNPVLPSGNTKIIAETNLEKLSRARVYSDL